MKEHYNCTQCGARLTDRGGYGAIHLKWTVHICKVCINKMLKEMSVTHNFLKKGL